MVIKPLSSLIKDFLDPSMIYIDRRVWLETKNPNKIIHLPRLSRRIYVPVDRHMVKLDRKFNQRLFRPLNYINWYKCAVCHRVKPPTKLGIFPVFPDIFMCSLTHSWYISYIYIIIYMYDIWQVENTFNGGPVERGPLNLSENQIAMIWEGF